MKHSFIAGLVPEIQQGIWSCSVRPHSRLQRLEYGLSVAVLAVFVMAGGDVDFVLMAVLAGLFAALYFVPVRFRERVFLDFGSVPVVAALLAAGFRTAVLTAAVGPLLLFAVDTVALRAHVAGQSLTRTIFLRLMLSINAYGMALVAGLLVIRMFGEPIPLQGIRLPTLGVLAVALPAYLMALYGIVVFRLRGDVRHTICLMSRTAIAYAVLLCVVLLPAGVVIAEAYRQFGWSALFALTLLGVLVGILGSQVAVGIHISLHQRILQLATLNRIGQALTANLSVERLVQAIYEQLSMSCTMTGFYIALVDTDCGEISFPLIVDGEARQEASPNALVGALLRWVIAHKEPVLHPGPLGQSAGWPGASVPGLAGDMKGSFLAVPMTVGDEVLGAVALQHDSIVRAYGPYERDLLSTAAAHAAMALRNARLFQLSETVQFDLYGLVESSRLFNASLDLETVSGTVTERMVAATPYHHAALYLGHEDVHSLDLLACWPAETTLNATSMPVRIADVVHQVLEAHPVEPKVVDVVQDGLSVTVLPMLVQKEAIGLAVLWSESPVLIDGRHLQLLQGMVNQAATAVHNALTHRQTDVTLRERLVELSAIEVISRRMSASLEIDQVIDDVLAAAMSTTGAQAGTFLVPGDGGGFRVLARMADDNVQWATPSAQQAWNDAACQAVEEGNALRVSHIPIEMDETNVSCSALFVPVLRASGPIGLFVLEDTRPEGFTESHARFVRMLAEHGAIAIENARLFAERRRQIELLIAMRGLSLRLLSAQDLDDLARAVVHTTAIITQAPVENAKLYLRKNRDAPLLMVLPEGTHVAPGEIARRVAESGEAYYAMEPHSLRVDAALAEVPAENITVCLPIQRGGENQGVLEVTFPNDHHYTAEETQALALLTNQVAVAIDNMRLTDAIKAGRDRLQAILDSTREGMLLFDLQGRLIHFNAEAERMLSRSLRQRLGESVYKWIRTGDDIVGLEKTGLSSDELRVHIRELIADPISTTHRQFPQIQHGESRMIDEIGLPVRTQQGVVSGWLLVWRDITDAYRFDTLRDDLTHMIVHDLRTPLSSIISSLNMVREMSRFDALDVESLDSTLEITVQSAESMLRMVQSLLDIARLEQAHVDLDRDICSLAVAVDAACAAVLPQMSSAGVILEIDVPDNLPDVVIDRDQIQRILINLLDNAVRYTPDGGAISVAATFSDECEMITLSVTDDGPGIPVEARARVFDKFSQLEGDARPDHRGMGLGLAFCKLAVEAHGGVIWVDDAPNHGAAFHFTLPVV